MWLFYLKKNDCIKFQSFFLFCDSQLNSRLPMQTENMNQCGNDLFLMDIHQQFHHADWGIRKPRCTFSAFFWTTRNHRSSPAINSSARSCSGLQEEFDSFQKGIVNRCPWMFAGELTGHQTVHQRKSEAPPVTLGLESRAVTQSRVIRRTNNGHCQNKNSTKLWAKNKTNLAQTTCQKKLKMSGHSCQVYFCKCKTWKYCETKTSVPLGSKDGLLLHVLHLTLSHWDGTKNTEHESVLDLRVTHTSAPLLLRDNPFTKSQLK